jgi:hypothetical protein
MAANAPELILLGRRDQGGADTLLTKPVQEEL